MAHYLESQKRITKLQTPKLQRPSVAGDNLWISGRAPGARGTNCQVTNSKLRGTPPFLWIRLLGLRTGRAPGVPGQSAE